MDAGRVVEVKIQGNNITGVLADGKTFKTYSPNYPELVEKLSSKNVSIVATPLEDKMPSLMGILLSWFPMLLLIGVWIFLCVKCKVVKVEPWVSADLKRSY